jgi:hypothetical protein
MDDWVRLKGGRYKDFLPPAYGDNQYRYDYEEYDYHNGERPQMRHISGRGGP